MTASQLTNHELVHLALIDLDQPVSVAEVQARISQEFKRTIDISTVRQSLNLLVGSKKARQRIESDEERRVRSGGMAYFSRRASLYFLGTGEVPARTVCEVVPGVRLKNVKTRSPQTSSKAFGRMEEYMRKKSMGSGSFTPDINDAINAVVEKLVEQRVGEVVRENQELRSKIDSLKSLFS